MFGLTFVIAMVLAAIHVFAAKLKFLDVIPRSRWLSAAGGVSVAYVFVHLLPELARGQRVMAEADIAALQFFERHAYLVALLGLLSFYGLERVVRQHRHFRREGQPSGQGIFWLHIASFAAYNGLVGYLLSHREEPGTKRLLWYAVAMGLHFLVTDYGMLQDHRDAYLARGRWVLAAALLIGWAAGVSFAVPPLVSVVLMAYLAGGVVLNVLKEELPEDRESRFSAFLAGSIAYAALLLLV